MKRKVIIGGLVLVIAFSGLIYALLESSDYYVTVSEFMEDHAQDYGESIRVRGTVVEGSIFKDSAEGEVQFTIAHEQQSLPVVYLGDVPHDLTDGKELTVRGEYTSEGVFHADKLIMKCASKYEPAD